MSKKLRPSKPTDQENVEKAYQILLELMESHKEIEKPLWIGAFASIITFGFKNNGFTHEEFMDEIDLMFGNCKQWWDE